MRKTLVAAFVAFLAGGSFAAEMDHWVYGQFNSMNVISNGVWMFKASVKSKTTELTVGNPVDDTDPSQCPTEIKPLDFSKPVIDGADPTKQYTIVRLEPAFSWNKGDNTRASTPYVGALTLPPNLQTTGMEAFGRCVNLTGHLEIPSTLTDLGSGTFRNTGLTSVNFNAATATINGGYCRGMFMNCTSLKWVRFDAAGKFTVPSGNMFDGCTSLTNADLSGVISITAEKSGYAVFLGCSAIDTITFSSELVVTNKNTSELVGQALFNSGYNQKLSTIRFTGAAPNELDNWIDGDNGFLGCMKSTQSITTIVPSEYRNVKNANGNSWVDYSESRKLNTTDSTWAAENVKSDVKSLSLRKLLIDKVAEDEPPSVEDPVVTDVWAYQATVTVDGSDLKGGAVFVSLTNSVGAVTGPMELDDFGKSVTFTGLTRDTQYSVIAVATNNYGVVTNDTVSFTTLAKQADVSVTKGGDADFNENQNGSFVFSRADGDATDYPLTVKYTIGGTAVAGTDYAAIEASATIPVGESSVTVEVVPLFCDTGVAGDTTVSVALTDDPGYAVGTREATVKVAKVVVKHYSIAVDSNPSGKTRGTFVVSRGADDSIDQAVALAYTVSGDGTNVVNKLLGTVVIPEGERTATIDVFANNGEGADAPLTVTLTAGGYVLVVPAATMTIAAGAATDYWLVDTSKNTMSWGAWTFGVNRNTDVTPATVACTGNVSDYPSEVSPLDFSIPVVDDQGLRHVITTLSMKNNSSARDVAGELTLPTEGLTTIVQNAFYGANSLCGDLVFPSSLESVGSQAFANTKITSIEFKAESSTAVSFANSVFADCTALKSVRFAAAGQFSATEYLFYRCTALENADMSGVVSVSVSWSGAAAFSGCSALTNVVVNSNLVLVNSGSSGTIGNALFNGNTALKAVRFTGAAPDELETWITGDKGYLGCLSGTQEITTVVPAAYRNVKNSSGNCWADYSTGRINTLESTFKQDFVKSDVTDLTNRKLLLDVAPSDEPPYVQKPVLSDVGMNGVTVTVGGDGLYSGTVSVTLTNALVTLDPQVLTGFNDSCTFDGLQPNTAYTVVVIASNGSGTTTNTTSTFYTMPLAGQYWFYDASGSEAVISNGIWTFRATVSGTDMTVETAVDDTDPSLCPTEIKPLDFSLPVIDVDDRAKRYTIVNLDPKFWPNTGTKRASADYVGKLTLPGEGLVRLGGESFRSCNNLYGDIVVPSSVTDVGRYGFQNSKITSITFGANDDAVLNAEIFTGCSSLTTVVFKAGGNWRILNNSRPFNGCSGLKDADLSGVVYVGGDNNHAAFGSCTMTNVTINSSIVLTNVSSSGGTIGNALFNNNAKLASVRFTGAAPDELPKWIAGDGGYLGCFDGSRSITTIVPAEYRNVTNSSGMSWAKYSATGRLNTYDSTFASKYVTSGIDLSKRKLILNHEPEDDPPSITNVAVSAIWPYQATVTATGYGIRGGKVLVALTNAVGAVTGPAEFSDFGEDYTFTNLTCGTEYTVVVIATNTYGAVTNAATTFTTLSKPSDVSVAKGADAYEKTCTAGSFIISRTAPTTDDLVVKYTMSGTATNGESYVELSGEATILSGESSVTVEVTPLYNPRMQEDATATLTITPDLHYDIVEPSADSLTVYDGGLHEISVTKAADADFNKSQNGSFVISRADDAATVYPVTVNYTVGGTAIAGTDYTAIATTATIPVGEMSATVSIVPLFCDTQVAGDTQVELSLSDDASYTVDVREASVNVKKVEVRHYSIAAGVNPTGTTRGTFIVSRGANDPIDQKVTLTYTISGAGASAIFPTSGTVVIPPYATSATIEIFGNNASGSDAQLTLTLDAGSYTLVTSSATITVTAGAQSECWLVNTSDKTMSWGEWTFGGVDVQKRTVSMGNNSLKESPADVSPLDFSLPVVDTNGNRYVITMVSTRGATSTQKSAVGELTLPGEGMTSVDYNAFNGCANMTGTMVFPTTCATIGGESFENCSKIKIDGRSFASVVSIAGKDALVGVSFEGEVLALSIVEVDAGGFSRSKVESIRFGSGLKKLARGEGRNGFFEGCSSLTNVVFDLDSRVSFEHGLTFKGCSSLASIDLSAVTNIDCTAYDVAKDDYGTFYNCSALTNVIFGANLQYLASNVFDQAFNKTADSRSITFAGLPPENFEMPYLSKVQSNGSAGYPVVTTYVHSKYMNKKNAAGKCWLDYAVDRKINRKSSTWASEFLPDGVPTERRPLLEIPRSGFVIIAQ